MSTTNTISVILPIKSGKAIGFTDFFDKCIQSVQYQNDYVNELIIVHGNEDYLNNFLNEYDFSGITVTLEKWDSEPNFAKQVNHGVSISKSNWCSILEFDDEYSNIWFKNAIKYMDIYKDVDAFLPIVVDVDEFMYHPDGLRNKLSEFNFAPQWGTEDSVYGPTVPLDPRGTCPDFDRPSNSIAAAVAIGAPESARWFSPGVG